MARPGHFIADGGQVPLTKGAEGRRVDKGPRGYCEGDRRQCLAKSRHRRAQKACSHSRRCCNGSSASQVGTLNSCQAQHPSGPIFLPSVDKVSSVFVNLHQPEWKPTAPLSPFTCFLAWRIACIILAGRQNKTKTYPPFTYSSTMIVLCQNSRCPHSRIP